ncbi:hypothetical protein PPE03_39180 [Pseudoalteromonas peptidolytica]|nr:hypothetical protein PPE03_39180 [Pseudoalteromonas peptidolytica]
MLPRLIKLFILTRENFLADNTSTPQSTYIDNATTRTNILENVDNNLAVLLCLHLTSLYD